ncbi:unnamed protein product [Parnassius apollo]|uniref:(apollo) hypothetical protein n=1 Tax=Parnassius apollo TaxID=110799 RepID=A0A8S3XVK0_PARAO|nr:unnamed protein product [Parnassius apollo]
MTSSSLKGKRKEWNTDHMTESIRMIREKKMGYFKAAKHFDVPRTTLFRLCQKNELYPEEAAATKLGRKSVLGDQLENLLVEYILKMESKFHGLTRNDARRMAYMLAKRNHLENPFGLWPLNKNILSEIDYLAAQQDAVKDACTINATPTKSSSQSKESSTNDARPPDNSLILTETSVTSRQDT